MNGARSRLLTPAFGAALLLSAGLARAEAGVSIQYESDDQHELARRVASELAIEGYAVDVRATIDPSPCDPSRSKLISVPRGTKAWIRLAADPADPDTIVASICYLGAQPFLQQASPSAPRADGQKLALATAEALNGLRARLPPIEGGPERAVAERPAPIEQAPPLAREPAPAASATSGLVNSVVLGAAFVWCLPDLPPAPGVTARATLGVTDSLGFMIDAFVPASARELASRQVVAKIRMAWLRAGPRLHGSSGDFELSAAALAGPALTWATAEALAPRVGTTDVTTGAVLTLSAFVEFPRKAAVFAHGSAAASALLPGVRVRLGDEASAPRGFWPLEASIGVGARWQ
jgi:hypothetical protein